MKLEDFYKKYSKFDGYSKEELINLKEDLNNTDLKEPCFIAGDKIVVNDVVYLLVNINPSNNISLPRIYLINICHDKGNRFNDEGIKYKNNLSYITETQLKEYFKGTTKEGYPIKKLRSYEI